VHRKPRRGEAAGEYVCSVVGSGNVRACRQGQRSEVCGRGFSPRQWCVNMRARPKLVRCSLRVWGETTGSHLTVRLASLGGNGRHMDSAWLDGHGWPSGGGLARVFSAYACACRRVAVCNRMRGCSTFVSLSVRARLAFFIPTRHAISASDRSYSSLRHTLSLSPVFAAKSHPLGAASAS